MKVLITGGAGYIGTQLAHFLESKKEVSQIIIYDNLSRSNFNLFIGSAKLPHAKIKFIEADILDSRTLEKCLVDIDIVYHLAALVTTPFADQNSHLFEQVNHWGTAELAYALEKSNVKKVVYLSSCSVYGSTEEEVTVENTPQPKSYYGISKLRGEEHILNLSDKMQVYIFRCGNVYGYNRSMRFDAVINKFMFESNFKKKVRINGNGAQHRPFIQINKVVKGIDEGISKLNPGTYNLVDFNQTVINITFDLREIFSGLEIVYVNHHLKLMELKVEPSKEIRTIIGKQNNLKQDLVEFKSHFTF